jgi:hypothetical protein
MFPGAPGISVGHCVARSSDYCPYVLYRRSAVDLEIFNKKDTFMFAMERNVILVLQRNLE